MQTTPVELDFGDGCPRCGGPRGPRKGSTCPGCWDTCRAKFGPKEEEPNPCGQPATTLFNGVVMMCERHFRLFDGETQRVADVIRERFRSFLRGGN